MSIIVPSVGRRLRLGGVIPVSGFAAPDVYEHSFEDSGPGEFTTGGGASIFSGSGDYTVATTDANTGTKSAQAVIAQSVGNTNAEIYYGITGHTNAIPASVHYTRFYVHFLTGFDMGDDYKVDRLQGTHLPNCGTFFINGSGSPVFAFNWDNYQSSTINLNENLPAPTPNDVRGSWTRFEVLRDFSDVNNLHVELWIDGTRYLDDTRSATDPLDSDVINNASKWLTWFPTFNSMGTESTLRIDDIAISSQRIGP